MLKDVIVLRNARYWAKKLMRKGLDFDELVNIGYLVGKPLAHPKLLKSWIGFVLIKFVKNERKQFRRYEALPLEDKPIEDIEVGNGYQERIENELLRHELEATIIDAKLTPTQGKLILMRFYQNKSLKEISKAVGLTAPTVGYHIAKALDKIKTSYRKRIK